jgi:hypothetical protein
LAGDARAEMEFDILVEENNWEMFEGGIEGMRN